MDRGRFRIGRSKGAAAVSIEGADVRDRCGDTDRGVFASRDGGLSWRAIAEKPRFDDLDKDLPARLAGWRIPVATWKITTSRGVISGGPGGAYLTRDGEHWTELKLWREDETGAADYLHAYWMGRYYRLVSQ